MNYKTFLLSFLTVIVLSSKAQQNPGTENFLLPDLLTNTDGIKISDNKAWEKERRPEILQLFEDNVYGEVPKDFDSINFKLNKEDPMALEGKATLKEIGIEVFRNGQSVMINLVLFIPNEVKKPAPAFLLINNRPIENTDPTREVKREFWPAEEVIARGYAVAAFQVDDAAADNKENYQQQALRLYPEQLGKGNGMKAIGAWGWGASRAMDYFENDPGIDQSKVAVLGHSRGGKAALWCGAQDERFAIVISNNSGCTGAALSRRKVGETLVKINTNFPHWFCGNYKNFNEKEDGLPVDQHMLIALMAPRAVYVASASQDSWADPEGEFLSMKYAEPVFQLYGLAPLPVKKQPEANKQVKSTNMAYHMREGGHGLYLSDWEKYMDFADGYFKK
jgi:dienelactone hydrolase